MVLVLAQFGKFWTNVSKSQCKIFVPVALEVIPY